MLALEKSSAVAVTDNTMFQMREGIAMFAESHVLVDHNLIHTIVPNVAVGDHADAIQVFTGASYAASTDLTFSNNAILQGGGGYGHGIFIQSERQAEGIHHSNILIENNLYSGTALHGITLNGVDGAIIDQNTIVAAPHWTNDTAITVKNASRVVVTDNIANHYLVSNASETILLNNIHTITGTVSGQNGAIPTVALLADPLHAGTIDPHDFAIRPEVFGNSHGAGFDVAAFDVPKSFQSVDAQMAALFVGGLLHHIV